MKKLITSKKLEKNIKVSIDNDYWIIPDPEIPITFWEDSTGKLLRLVLVGIPGIEDTAINIDFKEIEKLIRECRRQK